MDIKKYAELDKEVREERGESWGNEYHTIDDLPLTEAQKECVLEWLAQHFWHLLLETDIQDGHCKSYDPLQIEGTTAHTYVFDLEDGGRHHSFKNLAHLEKMLHDETLGYLKTQDSTPLPIRKMLQG